MNRSKTIYYEKLNSLRALAVLMVIVFHWIPLDWIKQSMLGPSGVTIFFVLSGFLITGILLDNYQNKERTNGAIYFVFMMRRVLRIFPAYYFLLAITILANRIGIEISTDLMKNPLPYLTFFYNHYLEQSGNWSETLSPLWSVSVEEQFYIMWAAIILFLGHKISIKYLLIGTILLGLIIRAFTADVFQNGVETITCIDCFAYGALFAYLQRNIEENKIQQFYKILKHLAIISFIILFLFVFLNLKKVLLFNIFYRPLVSVIGLQLVLMCIYYRNSIFEKIASNPTFQFIGKISYGLYLYHMVIPIIGLAVFQKIGLDFTFNTTVKLLFSAVILLLFVSASWFILEKPILRFKNNFKY